MDGPPPPSQDTTSSKSHQKFLFVALLFVLSAALFSSMLLLFSYMRSGNSLLIADQTRSVGLTVERLVLPKGGFLLISSTISPKDAVFRSEYLPPGTYTNFDIPNFMLPGDGLQIGTISMSGFVFEDTNQTQRFEDVDEPARNIFGKPIARRFVLRDDSATSSACGQGFSDDFSGNVLNKSLWYAYLWNQPKEGHLVQTATGNKETNSSTVLYSRRKFSGDLVVEVDIVSYTPSAKKAQVYTATVELTLFTSIDRIVSVKWIKSNGTSFLEPHISKFKNPLDKRYDLPFDAPLKLKIIRLGSQAEIYVASDNSDYQKLWDLPGISVDDLHVGFESYDFSPIPTLITSAIDNFSVTCP